MCNCNEKKECRVRTTEECLAELSSRIDELDKRVRWWERYPTDQGEIIGRLKRLEGGDKNPTGIQFQEALPYARSFWAIKRMFWPAGQFIQLKGEELVFFSYGKVNTVALNSHDLMASDWQVFPFQNHD